MVSNKLCAKNQLVVFIKQRLISSETIVIYNATGTEKQSLKIESRHFNDLTTESWLQLTYDMERKW